MTIRCTILLFAHLTDAIGQPELSIDLPDTTTLSDAVDTLVQQHDAIAELRNTLAFAVNESYATTDTVLHDGDTIALIPPVSGG